MWGWKEVGDEGIELVDRCWPVLRCTYNADRVAIPKLLFLPSGALRAALT